MTWQFNPYALPLFLSAIPLVVIMFAAWRHRSNLAARLFLGFTAGALGLVLSYAMELLGANLPAILFALRFEYLSHCGLVFWPLFALAYSGYETAITRRRVLALFVVPAIMTVLVWTNERHGLVYSYTGVQIVDSLVLFDRTYGIALWGWLIYLSALFLAGYVILFRKAIHTPAHFHGQIGWLILAGVLPAVGMVLTVTRTPPFAALDPTPYTVTLACIPLAISLFRFRLFDLIPAAYERVIESMDDAVIVCDAQYRIVQINSAAARLTGHAAQLVGGSVEAALAAITDLTLEPRSLDRSGTRMEIISRAATGARYYDLRVSPLRNRQQVMTGQVFVLREITDRKRAEQQALDLALERERVRVLETFIQNASHDFRTPISIILTSTYLLGKIGESVRERALALSQPAAPAAPERLGESLSEIADGVARMRDKAQAVQASATRLEKMVESMLEVTELERTTQFAFAVCDLNGLVGESVQAYRAIAAQKALALQFEPGSAIPRLRVDERKLRRAVELLVDNAIHYTPQHGAVSVSTDERAGEAVIQIRDTGIGISDADLPHIFEPFYRADHARSDATGGAGLGLSIAKRIVEAHAGRIEVESAPGQGSAFRIYLPLNTELATAQA